MEPAFRATRRLHDDPAAAELLSENGDNGLLLYLAIRLKDEAQVEQRTGRRITFRARLREFDTKSCACIHQ